MENNDDFYQRLVTLLKTFNNRPYHLARYLIENSALNEEFIINVSKSDKIKDIQDFAIENGMNLPNIHFNDISKMNDYFNSLSQKTENDDIKELTKELNKKMNDLIQEEKYEEAARLRDIMINKKIKRNK
jgi:excinuclease UvrABC helicase subunit UvrB